MTALGKCLVFHIKYPAEMRQLYWSDNPTPPKDVPDAEQIMKMAEAVGEAARQEVVEFLRVCAASLEEHFRPFTHFEAVTRRRKMEKDWSVECRIHMDDMPGRKFQVGVTIHDEQGLLVPWVWSPGGSRAEDALTQILGNRIHSRAGGQLVEDSGCVALKPIPLLPEDHKGFDVDREPIIEELRQTFATITRKEVRAILSLREGRI